jgi:hypothetical protein
MAENTESAQFLEKLALITDAGQELFRGKMTLVFELGQTEYRYVNSLFEKQYDENLKQFKVEISGSDFIFILDES